MATNSVIAGSTVAQDGHGAHGGNDAGHVVLAPADVKNTLVATTTAAAGGFKRWAIILSVLTLVGIIGIALKLVQDFDDQTKWGYVAAVAAFLLTVGGGAPLVAVAPVLAKANWVRPLTRLSAAFSLIGVVTTQPDCMGALIAERSTPGVRWRPHTTRTHNTNVVIVAQAIDTLRITLVAVGCVDSIGGVATRSDQFSCKLFEQSFA